MAVSGKVHHNEAKNRFEIDLNGKTALLDYRQQDNSVSFPHTEVPPEFEGKGYGAMLVKAGLEWAREQKLQVIPACPFVSTYIVRHPEWAGIVAPEWQERLTRR